MAMNNRKMNVKRSNPGDKSQFGVLNQRMMNRLQAIKLREELESRPKGRPRRTPKTKRMGKMAQSKGLESRPKRIPRTKRLAMMGGGKVMNPGMMALKKKAPEVAKRMGYMYGGKVKKMMGGGKVMKYSTGGMGMKNKKFNPKCDGEAIQGRTRGTIVT
jgi:hypothetical protein